MEIVNPSVVCSATHALGQRGQQVPQHHCSESFALKGVAHMDAVSRQTPSKAGGGLA